MKKQDIQLSTWTKVALSIRLCALMVILLSVCLVLTIITSMLKNVPTSSVRSIKRCCSRLITSSRTLLAAYFIAGVNTLIPSIQTKCVIMMDNTRFRKKKRIQKLLTRMAIVFFGYHPTALI